MKIFRLLGKIILGLLVLVLALVLFVAISLKIQNVTNGEIVSSGQVRKFLVYVPPGYDPARPAPLVISIHGYAEWPAHQRDQSGWNELADEHGFIVVYPAGTGFPARWRMTGEKSADVVFISDLIDYLQGVYNIDPARIYANGLSNGGGMSYVLGCRLSERIAAIGSVSGAYLFPLEECNPARPVPMLALHGTVDPIVPYEGGYSNYFKVTFPDVPAWIERRAAKNNCAGTPEALPAGGSISGVRYRGCAEDAEVVFYSIAGGGHSWPGGPGLPEWIAGTTSQEIDATAVLWEFFERHTLRPSP